jgi:hypothetical protein
MIALLSLGENRSNSGVWLWHREVYLGQDHLFDLIGRVPIKLMRSIPAMALLLWPAMRCFNAPGRLRLVDSSASTSLAADSNTPAGFHLAAGQFQNAPSCKYFAPSRSD